VFCDIADHATLLMDTTRERVIVFQSDWLAEFCRRNRVTRLSLFGSVIRDDFRDSSDVDFLVEFESGVEVGYFAMMRMQQELAAKIGRNVDLRTPAELSRYIRERVFAEADILYVHR
jgi:predicted nucleotidyltransferase